MLRSKYIMIRDTPSTYPGVQPPLTKIARAVGTKFLHPTDLHGALWSFVPSMNFSGRIIPEVNTSLFLLSLSLCVLSDSTISSSRSKKVVFDYQDNRSETARKLHNTNNVYIET